MQRRSFLIRLLGMCGVAAMLGGCGFQLRGLDARELDIDALALTAPPSQFTEELRRRIAGAGVELRDDAPLRLNLGEERLEEYALRGGDTIYNETELHLIVPFSIQRRSDGAYLLDQQRIDVVTTYQASEGNLLVRDELREMALTNLYHDATRQLVARLRNLERL